MADNYLERRMEDLRSGRLQHHKPSSNISAPMKKGYLHIPFPTRRVLVSGGAHGIGAAVTRAFLKADCKVAVFDCYNEAGQRLAAEDGTRFYHLDMQDSESVKSAMANLMNAWKDVEIIAVVGDSQPTNLLAQTWAGYRRQLPLPNSFGGRMIIIPSTDLTSLSNTLSEFNISVSGISFCENNGFTPEAVARLVLFMTAPDTGFLTGTSISIKCSQ